MSYTAEEVDNAGEKSRGGAFVRFAESREIDHFSRLSDLVFLRIEKPRPFKLTDLDRPQVGLGILEKRNGEKRLPGNERRPTQNEGRYDMEERLERLEEAAFIGDQ